MPFQPPPPHWYLTPDIFEHAARISSRKLFALAYPAFFVLASDTRAFELNTAALTVFVPIKNGSEQTASAAVNIIASNLANHSGNPLFFTMQPPILQSRT